ncbi:hypothetical protein CK231_21880 [Mesorhizobium loti]|nr:hypothetical protein CK231_21880 [Mesorhizobium loti]
MISVIRGQQFRIPDSFRERIQWSVLGCAVLAVWPLTITLRGAMPRRKQARRTSVRDIQAILRLTLEQGLSAREVGCSNARFAMSWTHSAPK